MKFKMTDISFKLGRGCRAPLGYTIGSIDTPTSSCYERESTHQNPALQALLSPKPQRHFYHAVGKRCQDKSCRHHKNSKINRWL
jgi:hypothetical protein